MATTTNYGWTTPDDTDLVKDGAAAIRTLGSSVDTTTKNLNPSTTLGDIEYRSSTSNTNTRLGIGSSGQVLTVAAGVPSWATPTVGDITEVSAGTGISVASGTGPIPVITNTVATAIDAKGDLIVGTGADAFSRLAVGTNTYTLVADSSEATGLKWAAPAAGGGMTLLQSLSLTGASVSSSTFSSAYKQIFIYIKSAYGSARDEMRMRLNADTGSNYAYHNFEVGTTVSAYRSSAASFLNIGTVADQSAVKKSSNFGVYIMNPADTDNVFINSQMIWGDATLMYQERMTGIYDSSAAITSITLFPNSGTFTSGTAYIYGVN